MALCGLSTPPKICRRDPAAGWFSFNGRSFQMSLPDDLAARLLTSGG
jgi:hypothetical protein